MYENMQTTYGKQFVFKCNIKTKDTEKLKNKCRFLKDVLYAWYCVNVKEDVSYIGKEIIWNHTNIKRKTNRLFFAIGW